MTTLTQAERHASLRTRQQDRPALAPVVVGIDDSASDQAPIDAGIALARDLDAPLVFVYVRRGPGAFLGAPVYQRRLATKMERARRALAHALRAAEVAGIEAEGEVLEGSPWRRIVEFARDRAARMVVLGRRRRRLGPSVSRKVLRAARRPVVIAHGLPRPMAAATAPAVR